MKWIKTVSLALLTTGAALFVSVDVDVSSAATGPAVSVDTTTTGNSALTVGTIEPCRSASVSVIPFTVDIVIQGVASISGFEADVRYNPAVVKVVAAQSSPFILPVFPLLLDFSDPVPDTDGAYHVVLASSGAGTGSGVIIRLSLEAIANGVSYLDLAGVRVKDGSNQNVDPHDNTVFYLGPTNDGSVVVGSPCGSDPDGDTFVTASDNCPSAYNNPQVNTDGDASGDACDTDDDNDGVADGSLDPDDGGLIGIGPDNCPLTVNPSQANFDGDSLGDACDPDDDNDGVLDASDLCPSTAAGAAVDANGCSQAQLDSDGDGFPNASDNCPSVANPSQTDTDLAYGDTQGGDACDPEDDGDGFDDAVEAWVGTNPLDNCGNHTAPAPIYSQAWAGDVNSGTGSTDKITLLDLTSYLAPVRRFGTNVGDVPLNQRWDIKPGAGLFSTDINLQDLTTLITLSPLMLGNVRAFDGPACVP
jgi:hypothetical protein